MKLPWSQVHRSAAAPLWGRIAAVVMRRPALTALPIVALLLLAASPLLGATFGTPSERVLPESAESRQVAGTLQTGFVNNEATAISIVTNGAVSAAPLAEYARELSELSDVSRVDSSAGTFVDGQVQPPSPAAAALSQPQAQRLSVITDLAPRSAAAEDLVGNIRDLPVTGDVSTLVGGGTAQFMDAKTAVADSVPLAGLLIVLSTFVLLFLFTGSVVQPIRALLLNVLSLSATLGVMVWIFQDGHLAGILGFTPQPMEMSMLVLLFCIAFGLSMDYEVFLTSRIKELHEQGASNVEAVTQGLARTGRIVTTAAALLAVSFFAFATSSVSFLQMFGLGTGLAILIDATLVRGVLVPAFMRLAGARNWYAPSLLRRVHRRLALSDG